MTYVCPRCHRPFRVGRSKSAHMGHCGKVMPLSTPGGHVALRAEIKRVAQIVGKPEGQAPSLLEYRRHGRVSERRVMGAVGGYAHQNPRIGWTETMKRLGFIPTVSTRNADSRRAARDVQRVALKLGKPHEMPSLRAYNTLGTWTSKTILKHLEVRNWTGAARLLGLKPTPVPIQLRPYAGRKTA